MKSPRKQWPGESPEEARERLAWCGVNARNPLVRAWLQANPPPPEWQGAPIEYAYLEMPA